MGEDRKELCLRRTQWYPDARRPVRWPRSAHHLSLHVRPWLERRMPELFLSCGFLRRREAAFGPKRYDPGRRITSHLAGNRGVQGAHGLAVPVGVIVRHGF